MQANIAGGLYVSVRCHDEGEMLPDVRPSGVQWFDARQPPLAMFCFPGLPHSCQREEEVEMPHSFLLFLSSAPEKQSSFLHHSVKNMHDDVTN